MPFNSWSNKHPNIWLNVAVVKTNVTKYSQFHVNNPVTDALKRDHGLPMAEYDGGVNIWGDSLEKLMAVCS